MCNAEIITSEKILNNITEEVHTYAKWQSLGYQVKKGEKAIIKTMLWKKVKASKKELEKIEDVEELASKENNTNFRLVKASLFSKSQVEKIAS